MAERRSRLPGSPRQRRNALAVGATLIAGLVAWPVIGQQGNTDAAVPPSESDAAVRPAKSLLPQGFDGPAVKGSEVAPAEPAAPGALPTGLVPPPAPVGHQPGDAFAVPQATGRDIAIFGPLSTSAGGYGSEIFARSRGVFLAGLARRIATPIGSRWAAITLRRALLSESQAPVGIVPGDWVAARAGLLLRIGEIDGAKALTDAVPIDRYTPALYRTAAQVALAAGDLAGLCPIATTGQALSADPLWRLAVGMCAALQGDDITAAGVFDALRADRNAVEPFDVRLGERVATLAGGAGRASNIDWAESPALTPYRYGVAVAAGVAIPPAKLEALGPARFGWLVRAPGLAPDIRLAALRPAAMLGTMSATELVSSVAALSPGDAGADTRAGELRTAFAGGSMDDRRAALRAIWASASGDDRYGALIESATAAAHLPIDAASAADSADIIAALLSAGSIDAARRWWPIADKADAKVRSRAWALLAASEAGVAITPAAFRDWRSASGVDARGASLLLAALSGLGRTRDSGWDSLERELLPASANSWTRAIDAAGDAGRTGEVAILAATGLQGDWSGVPPLHLYHIVAALVRTGRPQEARLIAAEAMTRG